MATPAQSVAEFGGWKLTQVPAGWEQVPGFGLRCGPAGASSIGFQQEPLSPEMSLQQYGEVQIQIMQNVVPAAEAKGPKSSNWTGAEEAIEMAWRLLQGDRQFIVVQIFAKRLGQVGIATFTTTDIELASVGPAFRVVREKLTFQPEPLPQPEPPAIEQAGAQPGGSPR